MEYLFLRRKKTRYTSVRQKTLLYRAASRRWEKEFALRTDVRRIDALIYKGILYLMEVRQVFLDSSLSLKTLSAMLETNQTYLSNVVPLFRLQPERTSKHLPSGIRQRAAPQRTMPHRGSSRTQRLRFEKPFLCGVRKSDGHDAPAVCGTREESAETGGKQLSPFIINGMYNQF